MGVEAAGLQQVFLFYFFFMSSPTRRSAEPGDTTGRTGWPPTASMIRICAALLCSAMLCDALACFALLCFALPWPAGRLPRRIALGEQGGTLT